MAAYFKWLLVVIVAACVTKVKCDCKLNVLFIVDVSGSVQNTFNRTIRFVKNITETYLNLGPNAHQIAWLFHTSTAHGKDFTETKGMTNGEFFKMLDNKRNDGGGTRIDIALKEALKTLETRDKTLKTIVIYITDGRSAFDPERGADATEADIIRYSQQMRTLKGVTVLATSENIRPLKINRNHLALIAGGNENVAAITWPGNEPILEVMKKMGKGTRLGSLIDCVPPPTTTTTSTTITTTPPPTGCELDLCLVLDASTTTTQEFEEYKLLAVRLIDALHIGPRYTHVAAIQFSSVGSVITVFRLNQKDTKEKVRAAILGMQHFGGLTAVGNGLSRAMEEYRLNVGNRLHPESAKRCTVLYSDGFHNRGRDPVEVVEELRRNNTEVYVVGLSTGKVQNGADNALQERYTDMEALKAIAGTPGYLFNDLNYDDMVKKIKATYNDRCGD